MNGSYGCAVVEYWLTEDAEQLYPRTPELEVNFIWGSDTNGGIGALDTIEPYNLNSSISDGWQNNSNSCTYVIIFPAFFQQLMQNIDRLCA